MMKNISKVQELVTFSVASPFIGLCQGIIQENNGELSEVMDKGIEHLRNIKNSYRNQKEMNKENRRPSLENLPENCLDFTELLQRLEESGIIETVAERKFYGIEQSHLKFLTKEEKQLLLTENFYQNEIVFNNTHEDSMSKILEQQRTIFKRIVDKICEILGLIKNSKTPTNIVKKLK